MAEQYWVQRDGRTTGPFSGHQLKQMAAAGMIGESDQISADQTNWQAAGQVRGLFPGDRAADRRDGVVEGPSPEAVTARGGKLDPGSVRHISHEPTVPERLSVCGQGRKKWLILVLALLLASGIGWGLTIVLRRPVDTDSTQAPDEISVHDTLDLGNGVKMKLVLIPAGKFVMGSPVTEKGHQDNEGPQRHVTISSPFYMGSTEVTQAQWRQVMGTEPWKGDFRPYVRAGDDNAASYISWNDAVSFCDTVSARTGVSVRLPTEAEWEYACRAGTTTCFCYGDDLDYSKLGEYAWYEGNAKGKGKEYAHPVGLKRPNAWGLHDMHGNVWEWCSDWYTGSYVSVDTRDPRGLSFGTSHVTRGGSWGLGAWDCRAATRIPGPPARRHGCVIGFRVVASLPDRSSSGKSGKVDYEDPPTKQPSSLETDQEVEARVNRGNAYVSQGELDAAISEYTAALKLKPDPTAHFARGIAYGKKREFDLALKDYSMTIALMPDIPGGYVNRGGIYFDRKQFGEALKDFDIAVRLGPQDVKSWWGLARTHRARGNADLAITAFSKVIELEPKHVYSLLARGELYVDKGMHKQAIQDFSTLIRLLPEYPLAYAYRAMCHQALRDGASAVQDWTSAIDLVPDGDMFYEGRAKTYHFLGQYDRAWADVKTCQKLGRTVSPGFLEALQKASGRKE